MNSYRRVSLAFIGIRELRRNFCLNRGKYPNFNITSIKNNNYDMCKVIPNISYGIVRHKSKKATDIDSDDEGESVSNDDSSLSKDSKIMKFNTTSLRVDNILKSALSISRNKIETCFYESRIRLNGKKVLKKSTSVKPEDELDIIKMISPNNPDHLYVSRVEVISITANDNQIRIIARRFNKLLIDNYEEDPFKGAPITE